MDTERQELIKDLSAQNASDSMDVFEGPTWSDMCAIVADDDLDAKIKVMTPLGMIDSEVEQHMDGMTTEEKIVTVNSSILMTMSDMLEKRSVQLHVLAVQTRIAALKDVLAAKGRRKARHE
jgi:hypothetical protein